MRTRDPYRNVRPGRSLRPDPPEPGRGLLTDDKPASFTSATEELLRLRCLVVELQNALHRRGADNLVADLRAKYGLPVHTDPPARSVRQ